MVTPAQPVDLMVLGDQDLWDQINAALMILAAPQEVRDINLELALRLNMAKAQPAQQVPVLQPAVTVAGTLAGSKVKQEAPEKFDGSPWKLSNFVFQERTYAEVLGILDATEQVKLALILLIGQALIWWRSVSQERWAILGNCNWVTFEAKLEEQFRDLHHGMRMQHELARLRQTASVQAYNYSFRNVYIEIPNEMSNVDALFAYINGLKDTVQMQVILHDPANLQQAMSLADQTNSTMWFAGNQGSWQLARPPQAPRPYQGIRTGYPRLRAGGGPSYPVPMDLGAIDTVPPRGFQDMSTVRCYNCGMMRHFDRQCRAPRRPFQQQGQANIVTEAGIQFYQPYAALPPPPPPLYDVNLVYQDVLKNE